MGLLIKKSKYKTLLLSAVCIIAIILYSIIQNNWIYVDHINVGLSNLPTELNGLKIAHISDVHLPKNASSIENIINKIKKENPDIIVITGDIIDASADIKGCGLDTLSYGLSQVAPTYAVTGNHEFNNGNLTLWKDILINSNVLIMDNSLEIFSKDGKSICILGLEDGIPYNPSIFSKIETLKSMPILLLAHRPELLDSYFSKEFSITPNLVFSGHAHGGQFRVPFLNKGIIAPNQGLFPTLTSGAYEIDDDRKLIVSRGLGNSIIPIRINNRPHIPIITLISE